MHCQQTQTNNLPQTNQSNHTNKERERRRVKDASLTMKNLLDKSRKLIEGKAKLKMIKVMRVRLKWGSDEGPENPPSLKHYTY